MKIGDKIKMRRMELGWSQRDLATKMGYNHHSTVARIEQGKVDVPQSRIVKFSEVLGVTIEYLMNWESVQKKNDVLTDIILKLREDEELLSMVETLSKLGFEKRAAVKSVLNAFAEVDK